MRRVVPPVTEPRLLRAVDELARLLRDSGDVDKAVRLGLRHAAALLAADDHCAALLVPGTAGAAIAFSNDSPDSGAWDRVQLGEFARGGRTDAPATVAMARLKRRGRPWGALALRWRSAEPDWAARNALTRIAQVVNEAVERIERRRLAEVRARIDRKVMEQLRPKDLFYQILDGLRSLTGYDHSGALLVTDADASTHAHTAELAAEQLAWRKGRSGRIGARVAVDDRWRTELADGRARGYSFDGAVWHGWDDGSPPALAHWLAEGLPPERSDTPREAEAIIAPLHTGRELLAVLKISAQHAGSFGPYEAELVQSFLPYALVALQNAQRTETLRDKMLQAERKHAMADLARGVSHDINNALGSVIPLVQQMRADLESGRADHATLRADLAHVERAMSACSRIFGGMLQFARRSAADGAGPGRRTRVEPALDSALAILGEGLQRHGITLVRRIEPDLPEVPLAQSQLEQVLLNLIANARDAMAAAGGGMELCVGASLEDSGAMVRLVVEDRGTGIASEHLPLVLEPFFTTKATGTGLGLAIVRSIVWQGQGRVEVHSPAFPGEPRPGARIVVHLPAAPAEGR